MKRLIVNLGIGLFLASVCSSAATGSMFTRLAGKIRRNNNHHKVFRDYQDIYLIPGSDDVGHYIQILIENKDGLVFSLIPKDGEMRRTRWGKQFVVKADTIYHFKMPWIDYSRIEIINDLGSTVLHGYLENNYIDLNGKPLKNGRYKKQLERNLINQEQLYIY